MKVNTTLESVRKQYPEVVEAISKKFESSKKTKEKTLEELEWTVEWGVRMQAMSLMDMIAGKGREEEAPILERVSAIVVASGAGFRHSEGVDGAPEEVKNFYEEADATEKRKKEEFEALVSSSEWVLQTRGWDGTIVKHPVLFAFEAKKGGDLTIISQDEDGELAFAIEDDMAFMQIGISAKLTDKARSATEGETFKHSNKTYVRKTTAEIEEIVKEKVYGFEVDTAGMPGLVRIGF